MSADLGSADLGEALRWVDRSRERMIDSVVRWCDCNSWSEDPPALREMAALLCRDFAELSLTFETLELPAYERLDAAGSLLKRETGPLLLWHHRAEAQNRLLLMIHYDTVYPKESRPSRTFIDEPQRRLRGPGAADAKGGIAVIRYAVDAIRRYALEGDWGLSILLNPDEEIGSPSTATVLSDIVAGYRLALLFEPTLPGGELVANRKGSGNWGVAVRGRSAHAGRNPEDGRNAVVAAAWLACQIDRLGSGHSGLSVNVGRIEGGGPLNRVPDLATLHFNVRAESSEQMKSFLERLHQVRSEIATIDGIETQWFGGFHAPPKRLDSRFDELREAIERAGAKLGREVRWRDTGGACDGSKLAALGLVNIDTMGPTGGHLHSPDEYVEVDSLVMAAKTVVQLIADLTSRP